MKTDLRNFLSILLSLVAMVTVSGQSINDECIYAKYIPDVEDYCSGPNEFKNDNATASSQARPNCWPQGTGSHDVWFSFTPKNNAVYIKLTGQTPSGEGTLVQPSMVIYSGTCGSLVEVACGSVLFNENLLELTVTSLNIGQLYFIRIDGRTNNVGNFKLCIDAFSPIKPPEADCDKAVVLCNKDPFYVENLAGIGNDVNEIENGACINAEFASVWYKWTCKDAGTLSFEISPNNFDEDDIDFIVYELPGGLDDCANKTRIRCMASGETIGASAAQNAPCFGDTGLSLTSTDVEEQPGCSPGDDNYVAALQMEVGKSYTLVINNFSKSGYGFSIEFGGTGTFLGPEAEFEVEATNAFECDKTIIFTNKSSSQTDSIIGYTWNFGYGADKSSSTAFGPHAIVYNSFGFKTTALTVESLRGCTVTTIHDFYVNPCCKDTSTLAADAVGINIICFGTNAGQINGFGINGAPEYSFSIDSINFQPNPRFSDLTAGEYLLFVRDIKGCIAKVPVTIEEPQELIADAGPDITIDLGDDFQLLGNYSPFGANSIINWSPPTGLRDTSILQPTGQALHSATYQLKVTDEFGCMDTDVMELRVIRNIKVIAPNIISANEDGTNDFFNLDGNKAIKGIDNLRIYDRWGNVVYNGENLEIGNMTLGWDGTFNGRPVEQGVYVWLATIRFLDDLTDNYFGDVTVIR